MTYEVLLQYALRIIAKKRYTSFEMIGKLEKYLKKTAVADELKDDGGLTPEVAKKLKSVADMPEDGLTEKVLARLMELKYLDDEQYAVDYITTRTKLRPRGQFLLTRELKIKGISSEIIKKKLTEQNISESEIAKNALEKRIRQWEKLPSQKQREKAFRFLSARGFAQDAIYKAINSCYSSDIEQNLY